MCTRAPGPLPAPAFPNQAGTGQCRSAACTHQAFLLPVGARGGGEDDVHGLIVDAEGAGAAGGGLAVVVVQENAEVAVARPDLPHEDVGAIVQERVGGAVEGLVVGVPPAAAGAWGVWMGLTQCHPELPPWGVTQPPGPRSSRL